MNRNLRLKKLLSVVLILLLTVQAQIGVVLAADTEEEDTGVPACSIEMDPSDSAVDAGEPAELPGQSEAEETAQEAPCDSGEQVFTDSVDGVNVKVIAGKDAFPEQTRMVLASVDCQQAAEQIMQAEAVLVRQVVAVEISFYGPDGEELEPATPVSVQLDGQEIHEDAGMLVAHLADDGSCEIAELIGCEGNVVTIQAEAFSIYAVTYTVDFHLNETSWSMNGKESVKLSDLLTELGTDLDIACVSDAAFSNGDLVQVTRQGEDWLLTSLRPFDSSETLTLALKDGSVVTIAVTDAQDASAFFHGTITANKESYASSSTAIYSVKYRLDRGSIHEGDFIYVSVPPELVSGVDLSVSSQHFSGVEDLGNGQYKLTFAKGAESALSGSFSMFLTTAEVDEQKTGPVTVGNDSSSITVNPKGPSGPGVFTDTINKDAADNGDAVGYGDYDYSEGYGDSAAQIGVLKTDPGAIKYRLYINNKEAEIANIVVTDTLPDGMEFDPDRPIEVLDRNTGEPVDGGLYQVSVSGNTLTFRYPGTLSGTLQVNYWVVLTSDDPLAGKYTNRADITYEQDGTPYAEHKNYILQGSSYSAANGEKSVDKTEISDDPEDQIVTYTIKFWNQKGFAAGEIVLEDVLDPHIQFLSASPNAYFSIVQDPDDPQIIHLENTQDISGTTTVYVRFMCDFSNVPVGYTVENTVGGNTTKTKKIGGQAVLTAEKTVDGAEPGADQVFDFELLDADGKVLQTKQNSGREVLFDTLKYGKQDLGKTYSLFAPLPEVPEMEAEVEWIDPGKPFSAKQVKETEGSGYEYRKNISTTNLTYVLREISHYRSLSDLSI